MKSAKTIVIVASLVFLTLSLVGHSAEQADPIPEQVAETPARPTRSGRETRTPTRAERIRARTLATQSRPAPAKPSRVVATPRSSTRRPRPVEDPHKDSVIMVEAFMVQARLSALRSLDVPQISRGCKTVTADHILKLVKDTDAAQVTAGAKLTVCQAREAKTESTARKGIYKGPPDHGKIEYVEVGTSFMVQAYIQPEERIRVLLDFEYSGIEASDGDADLVPPFVERNWSVNLYLDSGKPTIAGATHDGKIETFLIVTANIKK